MSSLFAILLLALFAVGGIAYATARRTGRIGQSGRFARAGPALAALVGVLVVWLMGWLLSVVFTALSRQERHGYTSWPRPSRTS